MNTLFDHTSYVNGMEYVLALLSIVGFVVLLEVFKKRPFMGLIESVVEDLRFVKGLGMKSNMRLAKQIAAAPFLAALYAASLPFLLLRGLGEALVGALTPATSFGWSPIRAYFTGRKRAEKKNDEKKTDQ
jgi:hypothetical protein